MSKTINPVLSGDILPTFFRYVVPSIIGLIAITTAHIVDGIFVGNYVGADALASITLLVPYLTLLFALAIMLSIGGSVSAGKAIGEQNLAEASSIFSQCLISITVIASLFAVLSIGFEEQLYKILNIPASLHKQVGEYFGIIRWTLIIQLLTMVLYYFVRADGQPLLATTALVVGALTNMLLDAYFIVYLDKGLAGAAYATMIAQCLQFIVLCRYFFTKHRILYFSIKQKNWSKTLYAAYNGTSEFINEISVGLIFLLINSLLITRIGIDGVAAFSVANYFIFLSIMLCYGIADALHLLVSQNYGAQNIFRIKQFLLTALGSCFVIGVTIATFLMQFQQTAINWFLNIQEESIFVMTNQLLGIIWPLFIINGVNIILSCYFTAIHKPIPSIIIASSRCLVLPALLLSTLYLLFPSNYWSFMSALPIAEWCTFFIALFLCYRIKTSFHIINSQHTQ